MQYFAWLGGTQNSTLLGLPPAVPWDTSGEYVHSAASSCYTPSDCLCHNGSKRPLDGDHHVGIQSVASCLHRKESVHVVSNTYSVINIVTILADLILRYDCVMVIFLMWPIKELTS